MTYNTTSKTIIDYAYEILDMHSELLQLRRENKSLKLKVAKYNKIVDDGITHNNKMMGNLLKATLNMNKKQIKSAFDNKFNMEDLNEFTIR